MGDALGADSWRGAPEGRSPRGLMDQLEAGSPGRRAGSCGSPICSARDLRNQVWWVGGYQNEAFYCGMVV